MSDQLRRRLWWPLLWSLPWLAPPALASNADELAALRELVETMRADYESRIAALEARLGAAEATALTERVVPARGAAPVRSGRLTADTAFNPRMSVILDGNYYYDRAGGAGLEIIEDALQPSQGGAEDHEHDGDDNANGFNLRETELVFSTTVDPYFDASAYLAVDDNGDVELEEAWFLTRALPGGLQVRGGKFLSDFGYINTQHPHQWDFVDQNLAYLNLLGDHGLRDVGLQVSWLPELPWYTRVGIELLDGDQERVGTLVSDDELRAVAGLDDADNGPRLITGYLEVAPDLGYNHALLLGASYLHARQHQEIRDDALTPQGLEGDADLWGVELVYKYDHPADYGFRDFKLQGEYLYSSKDLDVQSGPAANTSLELNTDGYYVQGLFGIAPRWQAGLRYDVLGSTNEIRGGPGVDLGDSSRLSAVMTWVPSEFSRLRLQWSHSDILTAVDDSESFDAVYLQYLLSLGSHGAHRF